MYDKSRRYFVKYSKRYVHTFNLHYAFTSSIKQNGYPNKTFVNKIIFGRKDSSWYTAIQKTSLTSYFPSRIFTYPGQKHKSYIIPIYLNVNNLNQISLISDTFTKPLFFRGKLSVLYFFRRLGI